MSNVIDFARALDGGVEPSAVLQKATEVDLETVMVMGWTKEGYLWMGSSTAEGPELIWLMELVKKEIMG